MSEDTENKPLPPAAPEVPAKAGLPPHLEGKGFKPGQSGNPAGRKPGSMNRKTILAGYLEMAMKEEFQKLYEAKYGTALPAGNIGEQILAQLVARALSGDLAAIDRVLDGALDKVPEKADINGSFFALLERARTKPGEELSLGDKSCLTSSGDPKPSS